MLRRVTSTYFPEREHDSPILLSHPLWDLLANARIAFTLYPLQRLYTLEWTASLSAAACCTYRAREKLRSFALLLLALAILGCPEMRD